MPLVSAETSTSIVGDLFIRDYDLAVFNRIGGQPNADDGVYYVTVPGVDPPSYSDDYPDETKRGRQMPGVPIIFAGPSEQIVLWVNPSIIVRRQDPELAMERWNGQRKKYVASAPGQTPVTVNGPSGIDPTTGKVVVQTKTGYAKYQQQDWAWGYDMLYTVLARAEAATGNKGAEQQAYALLRYLQKRFPPRDNLDVTDSLGSTDGYAMFVTGPNQLSEVIDVAHRVKGWSWSLRILGYLDSADPETVNAARTVTTNADFMPTDGDGDNDGD